MDYIDLLHFDSIDQGQDVVVHWEEPFTSGSGRFRGTVERKHEIGRELKVVDDDGNKYRIYCDRTNPVVEKTTADGDFIGAIGRTDSIYDRETFEELYGDD